MIEREFRFVVRHEKETLGQLDERTYAVRPVTRKILQQREREWRIHTYYEQASRSEWSEWEDVPTVEE